MLAKINCDQVKKKNSLSYAFSDTCKSRLVGVKLNVTKNTKCCIPSTETIKIEGLIIEYKRYII